jgi:hypothetical protein
MARHRNMFARARKFVFANSLFHRGDAEIAERMKTEKKNVKPPMGHQ